MKRKFKVAHQTATTLDEAFDAFIEEKTAINLSKSSIDNYQKSYNIFYEYHNLNSDTLLDDIEMSMFFKWINHMRNNELRPQSINHYLRSWRTFMNWCYERDMLQEPIKIKEIEVQEDLPKMYSDEEIIKMLEKPRMGDSFSEWRSWAVVSLIYATGLRASSVCAMRIEDIDFQREEISIVQQKNKKAGILPLTPALANTLREYMKKWLRDSDDSDYLFPSITGEQFTVNGLNQALKRYCLDRDVEPKGIHSIRHNFSRDMIVNGAGEYRLQRYLSHSSIAMSQHYVKLFASDLKKDASSYSPLDTAKRRQSRSSKFKKD